LLFDNQAHRKKSSSRAHPSPIFEPALESTIQAAEVKQLAIFLLIEWTIGRMHLLTIGRWAPYRLKRLADPSFDPDAIARSIPAPDEMILPLLATAEPIYAAKLGDWHSCRAGLKWMRERVSNGYAMGFNRSSMCAYADLTCLATQN
jgi:hypothetical protein